MNSTKNVLFTLSLATTLTAQAAEQRALTVHRAAQKNDIDALRRFCEQEPEALLEQDQYGHTPLIAAINSYKPAGTKGSSLEYILGFTEGRQTIHTPSNNGKLPLVYACNRGDNKAVKTLLGAKADAATTTPDGKPILSSIKSTSDIASELIRHGALHAYQQRERLLKQQLQCAEEMLYQERERYLFASGAHYETAREKAALEETLSASQEELKRVHSDLAEAELKSESDNDDELIAEQLVSAEYATKNAQLIKENAALMNQLAHFRSLLEARQDKQEGHDDEWVSLTPEDGQV